MVRPTDAEYPFPFRHINTDRSWMDLGVAPMHQMHTRRFMGAREMFGVSAHEVISDWQDQHYFGSFYYPLHGLMFLDARRRQKMKLEGGRE